MGRGGKRKGAGRKPVDELLKKVPYSTKLPRWLVEWLRKQKPNAATIIEDAVSKEHDLK